MTSSVIATYSLDFSSFLELAPSLRTQGAKFYTTSEGANRILSFTKLPLQAQELLSSSEPSSTDNNDTTIIPIEEKTLSQVATEQRETFITPTEPTEETVASIVIEETTTVDVVYLSFEKLSKNTKAQLIKVAANNNIELPKSVKTRKNLLVEFLANKIPAGN